jgi:hypothetical protein
MKRSYPEGLESLQSCDFQKAGFPDLVILPEDSGSHHGIGAGRRVG